MVRFEFGDTPLQGVVVVQRTRIEDQRGYLSRLCCAKEFAPHGFPGFVAQMNLTLTRRMGAVRGMHFQYPPHAEVKVISCLRGTVYDVVIDLRCSSPTYLQWHGEVLSAENQRSLIIPEGFAHGFQTLENDVELLYLHSVAYEPAFEGAVNAADPRFAISWPLEISEMSEKDRSHRMIDNDFQGIIL